MLILAFLPISNALATINVSCSVSSHNVTICYSGVSSSNLIRGFAIDIVPNPTSAVISVNMGSLNSMYDFFPGSVIFDSEGNITNTGTPVADSNAPGVSENGITIEMVSRFLKTDSTKPTTSGNLLTFSVDSDCTIQLSANKFRGGIVLEDGTVADVNFTGCTVE